MPLYEALSKKHLYQYQMCFSTNNQMISHS